MVQVYGLIEKETFQELGLFEVSVSSNRPDLDRLVKTIKRKRVGIELTPTLDQFKPKARGVKFVVHDVYLDLFRRLKAENEIIFLDSDESYERYAKLVAELTRKKKKMSPLERFRKSVLADYIYHAERDEIIRGRIRDNKMDFAFVGGAHAYFYGVFTNAPPNSGVFLEDIVNIEELKRDISLAFGCSSNEKELDAYLSGLIPAEHRFVDYSVVGDKLRYEQEYKKMLSVIRQRNLIKFGRILETRSRDPDYVGTWDMNLPIFGFFEMYVENTEGDIPEGKIIDCLGDAKFLGEICPERVNFSKEYTVNFGQAGDGEVNYHSTRENGYYRGEFTMQGRFGPSDFVLVNYSPGIERKFVEAEDGDSLLKALKSK